MYDLGTTLLSAVIHCTFEAVQFMLGTCGKVHVKKPLPISKFDV